MNTQDILTPNLNVNSMENNKKVWISPSLELILKDEVSNQAAFGKDGSGSTSSKS